MHVLNQTEGNMAMDVLCAVLWDWGIKGSDEYGFTYGLDTATALMSHPDYDGTPEQWERVMMCIAWHPAWDGAPLYC